jgi:sulfatase modifying factor 1
VFRALILTTAMTACGRIGFDVNADGVGAPAPPSCSDLPATCGPNGNTSCCDSPLVPAGMFKRSYDVAVDGLFSDPSSPATVSSFRLDRYVITVGRFRQFVEMAGGTQSNPPAAGSGAHPKISGSGWDPSWNASLVVDALALRAALACNVLQTWTDMPAGNENRPMNCINWYEAMAFCIWDGGFLPTEAEWNYVATGGDEQRAYPWSTPAGSTTIDNSHASYNDGTDCVGDGLPGCMQTDLVPVGSKPAGDGRWGQADLAGNVFEWTLDYYATPYAVPCDDCANLAGVDRIARGGAFSYPASCVRTASRFCNMPHPPTNRVEVVGARCAR